MAVLHSLHRLYNDFHLIQNMLAPNVRLRVCHHMHTEPANAAVRTKYVTVCHPMWFVRWKNQSPEHDTWELETQFPDDSAIKDYWARVGAS